jgi:hypothetical protein
LISLRFYRIYDIGLEIDLDWLENELAHSFLTARTSFLRVKATSIMMDSPPLLIKMGQTDVEREGKIFEFTVFARIFDIGAISFCFVYNQNDADFAHLEDTALLFAGQEGLATHFQTYLKTLTDILKHHINNFTLDPDFFEDYSIYLMDWMDHSIDPLPLLAGEKKDFSNQMREEILKSTQSYTKEDLVILSWDSTLLCNPDSPTDFFDLIEFANVQVFELRYYDRELSRQMEKMYDDIVIADKLPQFKRRHRYRMIMMQLMQNNAEISEVTEKVNNLIKVTEDVYYARVYASALKVLRSSLWSESVNHRIGVIRDNYSMLSDEVHIQHSNYLEWIVIILIAIEVIMAAVERLF